MGMEPELPGRPEWHGRAACRGRGDFLAATMPKRHISPALAAVCASCPVRSECARSAVAAGESGLYLTGVWAGVLLSCGGRREAWRTLVELSRATGIAGTLILAAPNLPPHVEH